MSQIEEIRVPDIGDFENVPVIDVLVSVGDSVTEEQPLVTLESDKASMDVPAPKSGVVKTLEVALGDEVSEGTLILTLELDNEIDSPSAEENPDDASQPAETPSEDADTPQDSAEPEQRSRPSEDARSATEVRVPDIGDFEDVPVIEIMVAEGDTVQLDEPLITLESDKASMDVPSPGAGTVSRIAVSVGDTVSEGDLILTLEGSGKAEKTTSTEERVKVEEKPAKSRAEGKESSPASESGESKPAPGGKPRPAPTAGLELRSRKSGAPAHATPSIRRFARELGVDLSAVVGTGRKGRITQDDVRRYVKEALTGERKTTGTGIPEMPAIDFSKFGEVETRPLSRIKKLSGTNLHRAWLVVPHVTHHDEADITELEAFRKREGEAVKAKGIRLTPLAFIMKASVAALEAFPNFNASLDPGGENLILKHYYHIGVAVDTPDGLMVPVVRDVERKGIVELARELAELSEKARDKKLSPGDMQGASFTISSLGGIGGTGFTPIVNAPEVAILGVSRSTMKPVYRDGEFVPRLMLPLSVSYDHRVIDGAAAARFARYLCEALADIRRLLL